MSVLKSFGPAFAVEVAPTAVGSFAVFGRGGGFKAGGEGRLTAAAQGPSRAHVSAVVDLYVDPATGPRCRLTLDVADFLALAARVQALVDGSTQALD